MANKLAALIDTRPGEGQIVVLALLKSFLLGSGVSFVYSSSRALFLSYFDTQDLAYVYIGGAFALMIAGMVYAKLEERISLEKLILGTLVFLTFSLAVSRIWFFLGDGKWPSLFLAIWFDAFYVLTSLCFWGLCNHLFDVRQAKRLFGIIGMGEFIAFVLAGFATPVLVGFIGTANLLFLSCIGLSLSFWLTLYITRNFGGRLAGLKVTAKKKVKKSLKARDVMRNRYLLFIHLLWAFSFIAFYLNDAAFNNQVEVHYADSDAMAGFFGQFFAVGGIINIVIIGLISGRVINRFGITRVLYFLPVTLFGACMAVILTWVLTSRASGALFWAVITCRICDYIFRHSFFKPAFQVLYQPFPSHKKLAAQISNESRALPAAAILTGGLLLLCKQYFTIDAVNLVPWLLATLAVWIGIISICGGEYKKALMEALAKLRIDSDDPTLIKRETSLEVLIKRIDSKYPEEVIHGLELLEKHMPEALETILLEQLSHQDEMVRNEILERIERIKPASAMKAVREVVDKDPSLKVRAQALVTYASLGEADDKVVDEIIDFLDHEEWVIQNGALVGLMRYGGIEGVIAGGVKLIQLQHSKNSSEREFTARAIGEIGISNFHRPLISLLKDESDSVRRAALMAAQKIKNPSLIPPILSNINKPRVTVQALKAIAAFGDVALPEIKLILVEEIVAHQRDHRPPEQLIGINRALGVIATEKAIAVLGKQISYPNLLVHHSALMALQKCGYQAGKSEGQKYIQKIYEEAEAATWFLNALYIILRDKKMPLMERALNDELYKVTQRVFALLSIVFPRQYIQEAQKNLEHSLPEKRAYALEIIENLIGNELKKVVFPLLEELDVKERLEMLKQQFPQKSLDSESCLAAILDLDPANIIPFTRAIALYYLGHCRSRGNLELISKNLNSEELILKETAEWAVARIQTA